ncbi:hypothetical protein Kpho02_38840 [Kitasatospora phosalacinea]|uniref:Uncharacterized protein n=1 Tax=Kitasatospora phosalacinea TaxID=2065 RepID=A0A9W6V3Z3_9ACTN|nr:hypothetical protein Kpho02_38840 [Kitasatospora phosalacinea]
MGRAAWAVPPLAVTAPAARTEVVATAAKRRRKRFGTGTLLGSAEGRLAVPGQTGSRLSMRVDTEP